MASLGNPWTHVGERLTGGFIDGSGGRYIDGLMDAQCGRGKEWPHVANRNGRIDREMERERREMSKNAGEDCVVDSVQITDTCSQERAVL